MENGRGFFFSWDDQSKQLKARKIYTLLLSTFIMDISHVFTYLTDLTSGESKNKEDDPKTTFLITSFSFWKWNHNPQSQKPTIINYYRSHFRSRIWIPKEHRWMVWKLRMPEVWQRAKGQLLVCQTHLVVLELLWLVILQAHCIKNIINNVWKGIIANGQFSLCQIKCIM